MILINYNDKRPIYEQIVDRFQTLILNGILEPDEKLPSVRALAMELSINPNTIQKAYHELESAGFIYSVKGRGNFVRSNEHLAKARRDTLLLELKEKMISWKEAGLTYEEMKRTMDQIFERGESHD